MNKKINVLRSLGRVSRKWYGGNCLSLFFISLIFLLSACGDADLARSADGLWYTRLNMKDEYGIPYTVDQYLRLRFEESDEKDGGIFKETMQAHRSEEEEGCKVTYDVHTSIKGDWEVILGDLYMTYDLYSLDVSIENIEFAPAESSNILSQMDFMGEDYWNLNLNKESIREEMRKTAYRQIIADYRQHNEESENEGGCYFDLQVEGDRLTFKASDINMKMTRVKE